MAHPKILVTGASGKTGAAVVRELAARGYPVRALIRRRDARSDALERLGVETVIADMFDPDQVLDAMRGTQRAYFVPFYHPYVIQSAVVFALAAREAGLESIVEMSQWLSHRHHPAILTRQTWLMDGLFAALPGVAHTILNPGMFADNFLRFIDFAALLGIYPIVTGEGKAAPVSNEDMARVAAAILVHPAPHAGKMYRPTGPRLLSGREMAAVIAGAVRHRVVPINLPFWMFLKVARQQRIDPLVISGFRYYVEDMKQGTFALGGGVTNVVEQLTGSPAENFETTARRYAALPFARQSLANRLKAFARFNATPFYPAMNLERWDNERGFPMPSAPSFSQTDSRWRVEHGLQAASTERS